MLHLRVVCSPADTAGVVGFLGDHAGIAHVTVAGGVAREPVGDVVQAVVARECAGDVLDELTRRGVPHRGQVSLHPIDALLSRSADAAERAAPGRALGLISPGNPAPAAVSFVYQVGPFSVVTALLAGTAGMIALTSAKPGALIGVFISATTVPAAGYAALGAVTGDWPGAGGAALQLAVNLAGLTVAGALTLALRRRHAVAAGRALRQAPGARRGSTGR